LRPKIIKTDVKLSSDVLKDCARNDHGTWLSQPFQPRRDVHAVPVHIIVLHDYVAEVDANAKLDTATLWSVRIPLRHVLLERDGTTDGIYNAGKLGQQPVTRCLDHPAPALGDARLDQLGKVGSQGGERTFLVLAHQPRVARNIGGEDGGKPSLNTFFGHRWLLDARRMRNSTWCR
jgi:hypothetical protein